ncbi:inositol pentakisphosphate 2-kinase-like protein [Lasiosphaeria hispida]|uniref:Inositol-pentakisphosphate 2-kinase n=1 Tax=Lasiosphaeria hispida TaxID=260671 RepID=A0AAJ0HM09_9PEZI|nr:inositol pentakisphosphate 2-kinase-like protein [Lasiosphaeria hispida]
MTQLTLPPAANCRYTFVGEGAANVVFEVHPQPEGGESNSHNVFKGYLLRVPKAGTKAFPYSELQSYWESVVRPLFEEGDLTEQRLVRLDASGETISSLNKVLEKNEARRRKDFRGSRVAKAEYGMLVEDMCKKHPDDVVLEFKPKWLAQSPSAPASARRCRNCAREACKSSGKPIICSLDFFESPSDPQALPLTLARLTSSLLPKNPESSEHRRLAHWLQINTLIPRLRDLQVSFDGNGPLSPNTDAGDLQLAMTLRDCSCFVRIPARAGLPVEAKIADLDKKNGKAKLEYWQRTERELIEGGYYEGTEQPPGKTNCLLERAAANQF